LHRDYSVKYQQQFYSFVNLSALFLSISDLNDFPKSPREAVTARAYEGVGIQCIPPTSGYASKYGSLYMKYVISCLYTFSHIRCHTATTNTIATYTAVTVLLVFV